MSGRQQARVFWCFDRAVQVPDWMLTEESGIGPKRLRDAGYAHLRRAARWILLNHLHDLSRYQIVTPAILHRIELCRVGMVSTEPFGILLGVASIRSVDDDPAIPSSRETTVIVRKDRRGQRQTDDSQKENTNDVIHIDFKIGKTAPAKSPGRLVMMEVSTMSFSSVADFSLGRI